MQKGGVEKNGERVNYFQLPIHKRTHMKKE